MILGGPKVVGVGRNAIDRGGPAHAFHHCGGEAKPIVRFAEARVVTAGEKLIEWFAMAIRGEQIAKGIEGQAEGVDLAMGVMLEPRAVQTHPVSVAGVQVNLMTVTAFDVRIIVVAVSGVEPTVETA